MDGLVLGQVGTRASCAVNMPCLSGLSWNVTNVKLQLSGFFMPSWSWEGSSHTQLMTSRHFHMHVVNGKWLNLRTWSSLILEEWETSWWRFRGSVCITIRMFYSSQILLCCWAVSSRDWLTRTWACELCSLPLISSTKLASMLGRAIVVSEDTSLVDVVLTTCLQPTLSLGLWKRGLPSRHL